MNTNNLQLFTDEMLRDAAFGLGFLVILLLVNTFLFMKIFFWFSRSTARMVRASVAKLVLHFMLAILLMSLVQVGSIVFWTAVLFMNGLIQNVHGAMLFAGSCYTTLGVYADTLPKGWQSVAFYIAFSGLFSFAIATSAMMAMLGSVSRKIYAQNI
jgi:hypothetical protein